MSRIAYVNGRYVPHDLAAVHIDDRGYQFGDGIYEVVTVVQGKLADEEWHLDRLEYSLGELNISMPTSRAAMQLIIRKMIRANRIRNGLIYCQITRGVMRRDHAVKDGLIPQLVMTAKNLPRVNKPNIKAVDVITVPDERWMRRDIKTIQLLPNCVAKTKAKNLGAYEALMVDGDGFITEGSSSNAWIVTHDGELITRPTSYDILSGITRKAIISLAEKRNLKVVERPFTPQEALDAAEAFVTSATSIVTPIGRLDGQNISDGAPGPVASALRQSYLYKITETA